MWYDSVMQRSDWILYSDGQRCHTVPLILGKTVYNAIKAEHMNTSMSETVLHMIKQEQI
jgi:hypothetical protein